MKNSKLLNLLEYLSGKELERLERYLQSPFFIEEKNTEMHKRAYKLFVYIIDRKDSLGVLKKEEVYAHIYSNQTFKAIKLNQLMAYLVKKIEQFIIYTIQNDDSYISNIRQKQLLLEFYIRKKSNKWYEAQKREIDKFQAQINLRDRNYYLYQFLIDDNNVQLTTLQSNRKDKKSLKKMLNSLDIFYVLNLLEVACLLKRSFTFDSEEFSLLKDKIQYIGDAYKSKSPSIKIYQYALELLELDGREKDELYKLYRNFFAEYHHCFSQNEARNLFTHALTYCAAQLNKGREEYCEECWDLYCLGLMNNVLYIDKRLMPSDLKNIITLSLRLKKYEWAEEFLHQHQHQIQATNPKEVYGFNLANVYFHQQKYLEVHQILASLKCKDVYYDLAMRRLEIKVLYDQEELEVLYAKLNAFRVFIRRHRSVDKSNRERNGNFLSLMKKLINIIPRDKKQIGILENKLQNTPELAERKWIVAKLEELKR